MASYERIDYGSPDGSQWGGAATDKLGFYGKVPVVQRTYASSLHATAGASVSGSFGALQLAQLQEIQNTFIGLGIWATA